MSKKKKTIPARPEARQEKRPSVSDQSLLRLKKQPIAASIESILELNPSWRLSSLDMDGEFGWHSLNGDEMGEIRNKLAEYEALTWREIKVEQADRNHFIGIRSMAPEAQRRLRKILPSVDELFSLRITGKGRIFGIIQDRGAMLVIWWDRGHKVCPLKK